MNKQKKRKRLNRWVGVKKDTRDKKITNEKMSKVNDRKGGCKEGKNGRRKGSRGVAGDTRRGDRWKEKTKNYEKEVT